MPFSEPTVVVQKYYFRFLFLRPWLIHILTGIQQRTPRERAHARSDAGTSNTCFKTWLRIIRRIPPGLPRLFPPRDASRRHAPSRCATQSDPPRLRASSVKRLPPMSQQKSRGKRGKSGFDHKQRKTGNPKASKKKKREKTAGQRQRGRTGGNNTRNAKKGFPFLFFFSFLSRAQAERPRASRVHEGQADRHVASQSLLPFQVVPAVFVCAMRSGLPAA